MTFFPPLQGPMPRNHPLRGKTCVICGHPVAEGEHFAWVPGKPVTAYDSLRLQNGMTGRIWLEPVHWDCVLSRSLLLCFWPGRQPIGIS